MPIAFSKERPTSPDIGCRDVKLRESLETLKNLGKYQKMTREPILKEVVDRVFSDMLTELLLDTATMDLPSLPARASR